MFLLLATSSTILIIVKEWILDFSEWIFQLLSELAWQFHYQDACAIYLLQNRYNSWFHYSIHSGNCKLYFVQLILCYYFKILKIFETEDPYGRDLKFYINVNFQNPLIKSFCICHICISSISELIIFTVAFENESQIV